MGKVLKPDYGKKGSMSAGQLQKFDRASGGVSGDYNKAGTAEGRDAEGGL